MPQVGEQTLFSTMTNEDMSSFNQQQYREQHKDDYSGEISSNSTPTDLMEIPQSPTQLSSTDSAITILLDDSSNSSNPSDSSNMDALLDSDTSFNPISFINTMHQKLKDSKAPVYSFSHDSVSGQFYCKLDFYGQTYENKDARPKKQAAKEEAASIAMRDLSSRMPEIANSIRHDLTKAHISNKYGPNNKNNVSNQAPHPLELIPKSVHWYNKQAAQATSIGQAKRPCVLLLEFCQMHKLAHPTYNLRDDGRGYYLFDCIVYDRTFVSDMGFWKKTDAKDHISNIAFGWLYKEFCEKEYREIQERMQPYRIHPTSSQPPPPPPPNVTAFPIFPNNSYIYYS